MGYGLKVYNTSGDYSLITTKIGKILASGSLTMSDSLEVDGTYGEDIVLGSTYNINNIGVIAYPTVFTYKATVMTMGWSDGSYPFTYYLYSDYTYYTKNTTTGVMSTFTAGSLTQDTSGSFDGVASIFPLAGWDYLDSVTELSSVRIWAATSYIIYDASASSLTSVYSIGSSGVSKVDYVVFLKGS